MTKIFALNPTDVKEGEEKPKQQQQQDGPATISPTVLQPAFFPVQLPISSIVARKKKCRASHLIIGLLLLWTLVTVAVVFHIFPDSFYRSVHRLISSEKNDVSGSTLPSTAAPQPYVVDIAEPDIRVAPKLGLTDDSDDSSSESKNSPNRDRDATSIIENHDGEVTGSQDGDAKLIDSIPTRFDAMKAIATLLKVPGVQQVAVVQSNGKIPDNGIIRPDITGNGNQPFGIAAPPPPPPESFNPSRVPFVPQMEMNEWELMNYRRAMREWLLRREMFRRRMMIEMERARELAAQREMPRFMMGPQQPPELPPPQSPQQLEQPLPLPPPPPPPPSPMMPMFPPMHHMPPPPLPPPPPGISVMHRMPPPPPMIMMMMQRDMPMVPPPHMMMMHRGMRPHMMMMMPRMPPVLPQFMLPQQPQPQIMPFPIMMMPPNVPIREQPETQEGEVNPGPPGIVPPQRQDGTADRPDVEQEKVSMPEQPSPPAMTPDGTPDRDAIFKELRSRAQMQQQGDAVPVQQQQQPQPQPQPVPLPPPLMMRPVVPVVPIGVPPMQRSPDEIFRELQQRALRMQLEQDRQEAEEREQKEKSTDGDAPVVMIADTFPRRPISLVPEVVLPDETSGEVSTETTPTTTTATVEENTDSKNSSEPLTPYFKFFDDDAKKNDENSSPAPEVTVSNDIKITREQSSEETNDVSSDDSAPDEESEPIVKPDNTLPQVDLSQDATATTAKTTVDTSEEAQPELVVDPEISQEKTDDDHHDNAEMILGIPQTFLEAPPAPAVEAVE